MRRNSAIASSCWVSPTWHRTAAFASGCVAYAPLSVPIAQVEGVFNAVMTDADPVGMGLQVGRGAGAGPTASAVLGDLVDVAAGRRALRLVGAAGKLAAAASAPLETLSGATTCG